MLSSEQVATFSRDGFLNGGPLLQDSDVIELTDELDRILKIGPKGFAEKSRLTGQYLSYSFVFYRRASESCGDEFHDCKRRGWRRVALCGDSDLAEVACLQAMERGVEITSIYDTETQRRSILKNPVVSSISECGEPDAWMLTDLRNPLAMYERLKMEVPSDRLIVPSILGVLGKT